MSKEPVTQEVQTPESSAYDAIGKSTSQRKSTRKKAETVAPTDSQADSIEMKLLVAQEQTNKGVLAAANAISDNLSAQTLSLAQNLSSIKTVVGLASIFEGENSPSEVVTAFLSGTAQSGFQLSAIASSINAQPLLVQAFQEQKLLTA